MMTTTTPGTPAPVTEEQAPSTAITRASQEDDAFRLALEPQGFREAMTLAAMVAKIELCGVRSPEDAMVRIMTGRALGIPTFAALRSVYVIEGRPALEAKLKVALAMRHPECEYFSLVETSPTKATYKTKRRGQQEVQLSFTIEEARAAGLLDRGDSETKSKNNWNRWPADMCRARASSKLVDIVYPDAMMGLPAREELEDERLARGEELRGEVVQVQPPPPQAPIRNFEAECDALKKEILAAKTPPERKAIRAKIEAFRGEAGEPWASEIGRFYNVSTGAKPPPAKAGEFPGDPPDELGGRM